MKFTRRGLIGYLVIVASALVVVLLVLIALGYLVLPSKTPASVNIVQTNYTILEGKGATGVYWFGVIGSSGANVSFDDQLTFPNFNGYPANLSPGSSFGVDVLLWNNDTLNHTVYSVSVNSPFALLGSKPTLPVNVPSRDDNAAFVFTVQTPNQPGASLVLNITINALNPPPL